MHVWIHAYICTQCVNVLCHLHTLSWAFLDIYYICNTLKATTGFPLCSMNSLSAICCIHHGNRNWNVPFLASIHSFKAYLHRTIQYISLIMCDIFQSHSQTVNKNINILFWINLKWNNLWCLCFLYALLYSMSAPTWETWVRSLTSPCI